MILKENNLTLRDYSDFLALTFNYSLKFSKTYNKIGEDFVFERAEIFEYSHKYFSIVSYYIIFDRDQSSLALSNDVLADLIIIYEDTITTEKTYYFKKVVKDDLDFLNYFNVLLFNLENRVSEDSFLINSKHSLSDYSYNDNYNK